MTIRPIRVEDAAALQTLLVDPRIEPYERKLPGTSVRSVEEWIRKKDDNVHRLVAERGGRVMGMGMLSRFHPARLSHGGDLGVVADPEDSHDDIARTLLRSLIELAERWIGLRRVQIRLSESSVGLIELVRREGFVLEATCPKAIFADGKYQSQLFFSRIQADLLRQPTPGPIGPTRRSSEPAAEVRIRAIEADDVVQIHELRTQPEYCQGTLQLPSRELEAVRERLAAKPASERIALVAECDQQIVGEVGFDLGVRWCRRHVGHLYLGLHRDWWGRQVASRLMSAVLDVADNWLNLPRVELGVHAHNPGAIHLYEKFGFTHEGLQRRQSFADGAFADQILMGRNPISSKRRLTPDHEQPCHPARSSREPEVP